jgi:hypothetical protein
VTQRLRDIVHGVEGFDKLPHADKLRLFAWAFHAEGKESVKPSDFAACYDLLHLQQPVNLHRAVQALHEQGDLLKAGAGLKLSKAVRDRHEAKHGSRPVSVQLHGILASLPDKLTSANQREYLDEAVACAKHGAWRASIVMSWNLAYDHVCQVVMARLPEFNAGFVKALPRKAEAISQRSELQDLKESEVIKVCRTADIIDKTQGKCLDRNLGIRNDAAHPSGATFNQPKAEAFILDVVQTIVLGMSI